MRSQCVYSGLQCSFVFGAENIQTSGFYMLVEAVRSNPVGSVGNSICAIDFRAIDCCAVRLRAVCLGSRLLVPRHEISRMFHDVVCVGPAISKTTNQRSLQAIFGPLLKLCRYLESCQPNQFT
jgi:hypothetical protein